MAKTISLDGVKLFEIRITQDSTGNILVQATFGLTSSGQIVTTGQTMPTTLSAAELSGITTAFSAVQAAVSREQLS